MLHKYIMSLAETKIQIHFFLELKFVCKPSWDWTRRRTDTKHSKESPLKNLLDSLGYISNINIHYSL